MSQYRENCIHVAYIFRHYRRHLAMVQGKLLRESLADLATMIDYALQELAAEERFILEQEFILQSHGIWWMEYYSKSTYYRLKGKALARFLVYLRV